MNTRLRTPRLAALGLAAVLAGSCGGSVSTSTTTSIPSVTLDLVTVTVTVTAAVNAPSATEPVGGAPACEPLRGLSPSASSSSCPQPAKPPVRLGQWQLGGDGSDVLLGIAPSGDGRVWLSGHTDGVVGARNLGGQDLLVQRLDPAGPGTPELSVQEGSADTDSALGTASAPDGGAYVVGYTKGDYLSPNAGVNDIVVVRLDAAGARLWGVQLGGPDWDRGFAVRATEGGVYVSGYTFGGFADGVGGRSLGGDMHQGVLVKLVDDGTLDWAVEYGGSDVDWGQGVAVAPDGGAVVTGYSQGDFGGAPIGGRDLFAARFTPTGELTWVTKLGTPADDWAQGVVVDADGNVTIVGLTAGALAPDGEPAGANDVFVAHLDGAGEVRWTRQFGTAGDDRAFGIAIGEDGTRFVSGTVGGQLGELPAVGGRDPFVAALDPADGSVLWYDQFGSTGDEDTYAVEIDSTTDRLLVVGVTQGDLAAALSGPTDGWLVAYQLAP